MPGPEVRENDVLVEIHAASVNLLDSKIRNGEFKLILPYKTPFVLGHDMAGVVTRIGASVKRFKVGDEVYARPADHRIGTFAEFIAIDEEDVAIKPKTLTMEEAASIPLVGLTAWQALIENANLKSGQKSRVMREKEKATILPGQVLTQRNTTGQRFRTCGKRGKLGLN